MEHSSFTRTGMTIDRRVMHLDDSHPSFHIKPITEYIEKAHHWQNPSPRALFQL
jgi:hypothetical protein